MPTSILGLNPAATRDTSAESSGKVSVSRIISFERITGERTFAKSSREIGRDSLFKSVLNVIFTGGPALRSRTEMKNQTSVPRKLTIRLGACRQNASATHWRRAKIIARLLSSSASFFPLGRRTETPGRLPTAVFPSVTASAFQPPRRFNPRGL